jgi:hypothetical protein
MRKRTRSRVDVLENEERSRKLDQQSSAATISFFCWKVVLAYYVGGLKPNDEDPGEAEARALNYESRNDYLDALLKGEKQEINRRFKNAARRLFAQAGLNFDRSPPSALFDPPAAAAVRVRDEAFAQISRIYANLPGPIFAYPCGSLAAGVQGLLLDVSQIYPPHDEMRLVATRGRR